MDIANKTALIIGFGREGASLARFLLDRGARVLINDAAFEENLQHRIALVGPSAEYFLGRDRPDLVRQAQLVFVSPGVPGTNPVLLAAQGAGIDIQSMTTLFFAECSVPIVGITGSSGKTTTTSLLTHILRTAQRDVAMGGNIGDPMIDLLPQIGPATTVVLELSSFQLEILRQSPHIAVITNISPNHLDRHGDMASYIGAKQQIVAHQTGNDFVVLNSLDDSAEAFAAAGSGHVCWFGLNVPGDGATVEAGWAGIRSGIDFHRVLPVADIPLLGSHNVENVLAALEVAHLLDVPAPACADAIRSFRPPHHRLEMVAEIAGVQYVDDSIATSPARAMVALQAIEQPIILIAGGRDKCLPWQAFAQLAIRRTRGIVLIGEAAESIEQVLRSVLPRDGVSLRSEMIRRCPSLQAAVRTAREMACPGDVVLLSPACASYDMFQDYEERGLVFAQAVEQLNAA